MYARAWRTETDVKELVLPHFDRHKSLVRVTLCREI
jgi:hypothetical protein